MSARDGKSMPAFGFVTVVQHDQYGLFGGLLLLDAGGRPLEFHCTAPLKTNRAQEILFGRTLEPYLYGEQIGRSLVAAAREKPQVICTDCEPMLALRAHVEMPVVLVEPGAPSEDASTPSANVEPADRPRTCTRLVHFAIENQSVALAAETADEQPIVSQRLQPFAARLDLNEPFARIREALEEAQRAGRAA